MYEPSFPDDFPSTGEWDITYFDEYEPGHTLHTQRVFVTEHLGQYKLLRRKTRYGWDYKLGEMDKHLLRSKWKGDCPYISGQWRMYTYESVIHLTRARPANVTVYAQ